MDLFQARREYQDRPLLETDAPDEPLALFHSWFEEANRTGLLDPTAMSLCTVDSDGQPSSRVVLLKGYDQRGFRFFTRYTTRKARALEQNPLAALSFHYRELDRQIQIEGSVERLSELENQRYFATRPRPSQIAAHAASGLGAIPDREFLEQRYRVREREFDGRNVPLPEDWGGYCLLPHAIEFWQGRLHRLHDRLLYSKQSDNTWRRSRLAP